MQQCLVLAAQARGKAFPNPQVGCVIVKQDKIIGRGIHKGPGTPHAEAIALKQAGIKAQGATLYVNLEPCCHFGNNPPCTDAIIKAKLKKVVFAVKDPHPLVKKGNSQKILQKKGIQVLSGILEKEARKLNEIFLKFHETKKPFVILKSAASLDGKIATNTGESQWITGPEALQYDQLLRKDSDAILVGVNTVIKDNPQLTVRDKKNKNIRQPLRIILDSNLRIPLRSKVLNMKAKGATLVLTTNKANKQKLKEVRKKGVEVIIVKADKNSNVDFKETIKLLAKRHISSILIEGGGEIAAAALSAGIVDKLYYFIAPMIISGKNAVPAIGGNGIDKLKQAYSLKDISWGKVGQDLLIQAYL
ncbi:bifunctional diaminohydroxyphosphoribosylaminopyrimidine deaminase/5-amino-6-(5-phosphoribosylamino)uracil reductase RibD [Candidatus Margulisiibacteriota bacterium]